MAGYVNGPQAAEWGRQRLDIEGEWPPVLVDLDLRYWADPKACDHQKRPSIRLLAAAWGWRRGRVERLLKRDNSETTARQQRDNSETVDPLAKDAFEGERDNSETTARQQRDNSETALLYKRAPASPSPSPPPSQKTADFVAALAFYNDEVRTAFDQPMNPTKLKASKGQGVHLAAMIKAEGVDDVLEVLAWWSTAQDEGLPGGAAFHRRQRSTLETIRRRFDVYLDKARSPYKASPNGSSNGSGLKAEAAAVLGKINVMIRDPRWSPADLGDSEHAEAARAGLAACGGIDDFRRSRDEIGDRIRFVAGYVERRSSR